jgi:hypothetical protein
MVAERRQPLRAIKGPDATVLLPPTGDWPIEAVIGNRSKCPTGESKIDASQQLSSTALDVLSILGQFNLGDQPVQRRLSHAHILYVVWCSIVNVGAITRLRAESRLPVVESSNRFKTRQPRHSSIRTGNVGQELHWHSSDSSSLHGQQSNGQARTPTTHSQHIVQT